MKIKNLFIGGMILLLPSCAHDTLEKTLDTKVASEPAVGNREQLKSEAAELIGVSPNLTTEQRARLRELRDSTDTKVEAIRGQSYKLRAVLIRDLLATNYDDDEVELIKSKLKDLENQRLSVIFGAVEQANTILGRQATDNRGFMGDLFEPRSGKVD